MLLFREKVPRSGGLILAIIYIRRGKGDGVISHDSEFDKMDNDCMPRRGGAIQGGYVYHALNRSNVCAAIFLKEGDYAAFEHILEQAFQRIPLRILGYCVMPNHWHMVVWPLADQNQEVSEFFRWLTVTHVQRRHAHYHSAGEGHLYQGRFKSFPVESDEHLYTVLRYVERNPLRANLVECAQDWRWSSLWRYTKGDRKAREFLRALADRSTGELDCTHQPGRKPARTRRNTPQRASRTAFRQRTMERTCCAGPGTAIIDPSPRSPQEKHAHIMKMTPVPFSPIRPLFPSMKMTPVPFLPLPETIVPRMRLP